MNYRKVYGGTPVGGESRCDTCVHAWILQGYAESVRIRFCDARYPSIQVPFKIYERSSYMDKRLPGDEEMKEIAWVLRTKSAGHQAGFLTPDQNAQFEQKEQDEDDEAV